MEDGSESAEGKYSRSYFVELVDQVHKEEDIADLITFYGTLSSDQLELTLPSLCLLAEKCPESLEKRMMDLVFSTLIDANSSRSARKAAISCLQTLTRGESLWCNFFTLAQCLEEPQFHILNPVLPRLDLVLQSIYSNLLAFKWAKVLFIRALAHSNGWIRLWALEKLLAVKPIFMASDEDLLFSVLLKHLDSNDPFWRLLERQKLKSFVKALTDLFEGIFLVLDDASRGDFMRKTIRSASEISSPSSLFFISEALKAVNPSRCLSLEDFPSLIALARKTRHIQHTTMRLSTMFNYVLFFSKALESSCEAVNELGILTAFFSREDPCLLNSFIDMKTSQDMLRTVVEPVDMVELALHSHRNLQKDDFAVLLWTRARLSELTSLDHDLAQLIHGYVLLRCAVTAASETECYVILTVYMGLLKRLKYSFKPIADLALTLISEKGIPLTRETLLVRVLDDIYETLTSNEKDDVAQKFARYIGGNALSPLQRTMIMTDSSDCKDVNKLASALQQYRLSLVLKCRLPTVFQKNADDVVKECIDCLECASAYPVAECYLDIAGLVIEKVSYPQTLLAMLAAAFNAMNEERKSQYFLPALRRTLSLCLKKFAVAHSDATQFVLEKCSELLQLAHLNTPVALLISQCLLDACRLNPLCEDWANIVFDVAVFGPIPKKEQKVLNAAYDMIYEQRVNEFNDIHRPFEVVQRTRLNGICIALRLCKDDAKFAKHLVQHLITEINSLNKSSSRSFGLSLAHRQNTRAVALLLLIADFVQDEDVIDVVFSECVDWIVDPCQQFSIKLLLEWVLVRLALRSPQLKQRVIDLEKLFVVKRIGSVTSWINIMVLMSRSEEQEESLPIYIEMVLPWATAQNFAVRCTAIAALRLLYNRLPHEKLSEWKLLRKVVEFDGEPSGNSKRIIENLLADFYFAHLHPTQHFDMQTILVEIPAKTGMPFEETIAVELLKKFNLSEVSSINGDSRFLSAQSLVYSALSKSSRCAPDMNDGPDVDSMQLEGSSLVQRKLITKERNVQEDCSIIVVASLVDKPNNLGGLCRTCEIFGVDELVIADPIFVSDVGFKALSLSSEKKQKIDYVRPERLLSYLEEMRSKGYTVIAAEQTTDSIFLHKFNFPKKVRKFLETNFPLQRGGVW
ncbi:hypothetical protein GCK32_006051, partial [Trichostrongylus colubriformis]